jgi:hypothetical protein
MQLNVPPAKQLPRIFVISYDEEIGVQRSELLKSRGYDVISAIGNEAAKFLLSSIQRYDLFIVGYAAPKETRREMVDWLNVQYPRVKVLALNPSYEQVPAADYNAPYHASDTWLAIVSTVCERRYTAHRASLAQALQSQTILK